MSDYNYHGYTIKKVRRDVEGIVYEVYKDGKMIGWDNKEKVAKDIADWHAQYN